MQKRCGKENLININNSSKLKIVFIALTKIIALFIRVIIIQCKELSLEKLFLKL